MRLGRLQEKPSCFVLQPCSLLHGRRSLIVYAGKSNERPKPDVLIGRRRFLAVLHFCFYSFLALYLSARLPLSPLLVLCHNISRCSAASSTGLKEVARDQFTNCFLAARNTLLASPFRLHFRLRFPHSAQRL